MDRRGEGKRERKGGRSKYKKTTIASVGISFYKVVFPVTVLSIVVNISSQSKHTWRERGEERLYPSPTYCTSPLITLKYAAKAFCSSFLSLTFSNSLFCNVSLFDFLYTLLDESRSSCFFICFVSSFLRRKKTPKYQLGSFTVHFSAMRTHAPSLVVRG